MTEVKNEGSVMSKTNTSNIGNSRFDGVSKLAEVREKPFRDSEFGSEPPVEEMHWMAYAAYNQSK